MEYSQCLRNAATIRNRFQDKNKKKLEEISRRKTVYCKQRYRPKFARRVMRIEEQLCKISPGQKRIKNQHLQNLDLSDSQEIAKLTQLVLDMKAEMGSMRTGMIRSVISFDKPPNEQKPREQAAGGKQKDAQRSLVQVLHKEEDSDSDDYNQPEFGGVAIAVARIKSM